MALLSKSLVLTGVFLMISALAGLTFSAETMTAKFRHTLSTDRSVEDSSLYFLDGEFVQALEYNYTINATRKEDGTADIIMCVLPSFDEQGYRQDILLQEMSDFPDASYIQEHEDYVEFKWSDAPQSVSVRRFVRINHAVEYEPFVSSAPFPVDQKLFPIDVSPYLKSESLTQADDPEIKRISEQLTTASLCQMDAVGKVLSWVRSNIAWACSMCMLGNASFVFSDASNTLKYRIGNCNNMANLAIAMLRASGIPSVRVGGFVADRPESNTGHVWIAVLYPDLGWIEHESSYWMPAGGLVPTTILMPQHVTFHIPSQPWHFLGEEEFHQADWTIDSLPRKSCNVVQKVDNDRFLVYPLVAEFQNYGILFVNWSTPPPGWRVASSLNVINFSKTSSETFFFTIATPETGDVDGTITVTLSSSDGTQVGEVLIRHVHDLLLSDLNYDGVVNIIDITIVAKAFGSKQGEPNWNELADLDKNGTVNILDVTMVAKDYGKTV